MMQSLVGGILIGIAASLLLLTTGRVAGVSGILSSSLFGNRSERSRNLAFLGGMIFGGIVLALFAWDAFADLSGRGAAAMIFSGLFVGFGTALGHGCTSGHGVCGISRLSPRSIIATLLFIAAGVMTVTLIRSFTGGR
jgi:uncharacterized membrane protein YedE/YeeE